MGNSAGTLDGGGVLVKGDVTITSGTFANNTAGRYGGGLAVLSAGRVTVEGTLFENNSADNSGGAVFVNSLGNVLNGITVTRNQSVRGGGIANGALADVSPVRGAAVSSTAGRAVDNTFVVSIVGATIVNNDAQLGGGIVNNRRCIGSVDRCTIFVENSVVTSNAVTSDGGGIFNRGRLTVSASRLQLNTAVNGGAIHNASGTITVTHSILSANTVSDDGGGIFDTCNNSMTIDSSLLAGNSAQGFSVKDN